MTDAQSSLWKQACFDAPNESDTEKLAERCTLFEKAILDRVKELSESSEDHEERSEMPIACTALSGIQVNGDGCPSPILAQLRVLKTWLA